MARKSEVYSWRVSPALKASLEDAARRAGRSVAQLLEDIVTDRLTSADDATELARQRELHSTAARLAGSIRGRDARRSAEVRQRVRRRLRRTRRER